jgi:hypothetical protein
MTRAIAALLLASSIALLVVAEAAAKRYRPCNSCGEEIPQFRRFVDNTVVDMAALFGAPAQPEANKATPRRRAHSYTWQGSCYALDRSHQWRWVDPAFC